MKFSVAAFVAASASVTAFPLSLLLSVKESTIWQLQPKATYEKWARKRAQTIDFNKYAVSIVYETQVSQTLALASLSKHVIDASSV